MDLRHKKIGRLREQQLNLRKNLLGNNNNPSPLMNKVFATTNFVVKGDANLRSVKTLSLKEQQKQLKKSMPKRVDCSQFYY